MKRIIAVTLLFTACLISAHAQNVRVLSNTYNTFRINGDVWVVSSSDETRLFVNQEIPNTANLKFAPNSYVKLRDETNKEYKEFHNGNSTTIKYAFALDRGFNQPPTYEGLYEAAVSLRNQSDDGKDTPDLVSFNVGDLSQNKDLQVSIAKPEGSGDTWNQYVKSKARSFKKKSMVSLYLTNTSDKPLYVDGLLLQQGMSTPMSLVRNLDSSVGRDYIIIPPKDHILVLTDMVAWSKVSVRIISSTEAFVVIPDPFVPDSYMCTTENGTKWSVFKNDSVF